MALLLLVSTATAYSLSGNAASLRTASRMAAPPTMQYEVQAETVKVFGETQPYKFMTVQPLFTVTNWDRAKAIMEDYVARTRTDYQCMFCGWSTSSEQLFGRVAHVDGDAVIKHLQSIGPCLDQLTAEGVATLDEISIHGPAEELTKCESALKQMGSSSSPPPPPPPPAAPAPGGLFGALFGGGAPPPPPPGDGPNAVTAELLRSLVAYYEIDDGISFITKEAGGVSLGQRLCTVQQTYKVADWERAKPLMDECTEKVKDNSGVIYFGWTRDGDSLFCREAYASAKSVLKRIDNLKESTDALVADGIATLERTQIHGPMAQTQLIKDSFRAYGFGGPRPKSQFDTLEEDKRFKEAVTEEAEAAQKAEMDAQIQAAKDAAAKVAFFNIDGGFQRFEAVRLGGFEQ